MTPRVTSVHELDGTSTRYHDVGSAVQPAALDLCAKYANGNMAADMIESMQEAARVIDLE
jgi:hypothetical protein